MYFSTFIARSIISITNVITRINNHIKRDDLADRKKTPKLHVYINTAMAYIPLDDERRAVKSLPRYGSDVFVTIVTSYRPA